MTQSIHHISLFILPSIDWETFSTKLLEKIGLFLLLWVFVILGKKFIHFIIRQTMDSKLSLKLQSPARKQTMVRLLENLTDYLLYFLSLYWSLLIIGVPVSSLLAGAGIAGIAVGLGAQGFLTDLINGFFILFEQQFDVGDSVIIGNVSGIVASVGIRTTQVRGFDGSLHFIPNRHITIISNHSRGHMRALIDIPLFANADLSKIYQIIESINEKEVKNYPAIVKEPSIMGPQTNANGQFVFRIAIFTQHGQQAQIYNTFFGLYQEALIKEGVELPTTHVGYHKI